MGTRKILVLGTGRAGRARLKAIEALKPSFEGVGLSARDGEFSVKLEKYLADESVVGVIVCTANESHFRLAEAALKARKHTAVEFPLCRSHAEAKHLYELADSSNCVLHVEFIGLMTGTHRALAAVPANNIAKIQVDMSGGYYRWVKDDAESGHLGTLLVGRLQALHHLVGSLVIDSVDLQQSSEGYDLRLQLKSEGGVAITLRDQRADGASRLRRVEVFGHDGQLISPSPLPLTKGLFEADLALFLERAEGGDDVSAKQIVNDQDVLAVMMLADAISKQCILNSNMV